MGAAASFASPDASSHPLKPLAGYEGSLELAAAEINLPSDLVLHDTGATLELANGKLRLAPMRVGLPEGAIEGELATSLLDADDLTVDTRLTANSVGVAGLGGPDYNGKVDGRLEGTLAAGPIQVMLARSRLRFEGKGESVRCRRRSWDHCKSPRCLRTGGSGWTRCRQTCRKAQ